MNDRAVKGQADSDTDQLELGLGFDVIRSYKRLSYTAWYALAEFVDNSTQAYFNNRTVLDPLFAAATDKLEVGVVYDRDQGFFRVSDNSIGMSLDELRHALQIGAPPADTSGRSKYGMGMKTAACWLGNSWSVRTTKLGDPTEYSVEVDVEVVASGANVLPRSVRSVEPDQHYTVIEIWNLNQKPQGRTIGKIKDFLRSMYREDLRQERLSLLWAGENLTWPDDDAQYLQARDGSRYKKTFSFTLSNGKRAWGWLGVLDRGGRAKAGFAILHAGRVVRGWPDSWRPESIYGQIQGSNDLVNQRIVGEINLDDFDVTHTKDDILWMGTEDEVQEKLRAEASTYIDIAKKRRKRDDSERGPSDVEMKAALDQFHDELTSPEIADLITLAAVPPPEVAAAVLRPVLESIATRTPDFDAMIGGLTVLGYLAADLSPNDPYVAVDATSAEHITIVLNTTHPYMDELSGAEGFLNYLRQSTYDAVAEWKAAHKSAGIGPDTIKLIKDQLLRLPSRIEMRIEREEAEAAS